MWHLAEVPTRDITHTHRDVVRLLHLLLQFFQFDDFAAEEQAAHSKSEPASTDGITADGRASNDPRVQPQPVGKVEITTSHTPREIFFSMRQSAFSKTRSMGSLSTSTSAVKPRMPLRRA